MMRIIVSLYFMQSHWNTKIDTTYLYSHLNTKTYYYVTTLIVIYVSVIY